MSFALALGFESFEPDELLPAGLPLDDLARRALLQKLRQVWREEGPESVIRLLRKELGDEAAEKLLQHLDEVGVYTDEAFEGLGRLSSKQAREIQAIVDEVGEPLYAVGGVTYHANFDDIDYAAYTRGAWEAYLARGPLPGAKHPPFPLDAGWGVQEDLGYILFRPGQRPVFVKPTAR